MTKAELIAMLEEMKAAANARAKELEAMGAAASGAMHMRLGAADAYNWAVYFAKMLEDCLRHP